MGRRELVAFLSLSSWCLVMVVWLLVAVPWVCLRFVIVVFPDNIHLLSLCPFDELSISIIYGRCSKNVQVTSILSPQYRLITKHILFFEHFNQLS